METLTPQQLADEGQAHYKLGEFLSAARLFKAAADGFLLQGDELMAAEMANNCSTAYLKGGEAQSALEEARGTERVFAEAGDIRRQAMAWGNQAAAMEALGDLDQALSAYRQCVELFKQTGETEMLTFVYQSISSILLRQRRYLEAYANMRAGFMGIEKPNRKQRLLRSLLEIPFRLLK